MFPARFGTSPTDATRESFCSSLQKIAADGFIWLFNAKKCYGLSILNYAVTSNHIHLVGVVTHPSQWPFSGFNEIQNPKRKKALIDYER